MLGGYSTGVLGLNQSTRTLGMTVSAAWALDRQWTLTGAFSQTGTRAPAPQGMLQSSTPVLSQSYGLGLVRGDTWRQGDRLSFALQTPLHARTGTLRYSVVTGVTDEGAPIFGTHTVKLAPTAREWNLESRYVMRAGRDASLSAAAVLRVNPDHDADARPQLVMGLRYNLSF